MAKLLKKAALYAALVMGCFIPAFFTLFFANFGGIDVIALLMIYVIIVSMYLMYVLTKRYIIAGIFVLANTYLLYKILLVEWSVVRYPDFGEIGVPLQPVEQGILAFIVLSGVTCAVVPIWLKVREHLLKA